MEDESKLIENDVDGFNSDSEGEGAWKEVPLLQDENQYEWGR